MGLVDGPGIRTVIFLQGCLLRCKYCHNPDTWKINEEKAEKISSDELLKRILRFKPYYGSEGGVTFSGGEPLLQADFLCDILPKLKKEGIGTCLDTAGVGVGRYEEILKNTDLILFDVKHYTSDGYKKITGRDMDESLKFLEIAQRLNVKMWIRHVVVPGLTDGEEHFKRLEEFIKTLKNVEKIELLPYHVLGVPKYREMNIPYPLEGVKPMDGEKLKEPGKRLNDVLNLKNNTQ